MKAMSLLPLTLRSMRSRLLLLLAFVVLFLAAAVAARVLAGSSDHGHVELGRFFAIGGPTLASAFLLVGWSIGRFPLVATLVLVAGMFSLDRSRGYARIYAVRPVSRLRIYGTRLAALLAIAFIICALLVPAFDTIVLGHWSGPATLVLIGAYVLTYGSLAALLSVWTRADAWLALLLGLTAILWHSLRVAGALDGTAPGIRQVITVLLPPHGALLAMENAFANLQPVPWNAVLYVLAYTAFMLILAGASLVRREI